MEGCALFDRENIGVLALSILLESFEGKRC